MIRKRVPYVCPWNGTTVNGLYEQKGTNRWRMTEGPLAGTQFRENDPHEAVRRFYEMTSGKVETVPVPFTPKGKPKVRPGGATFDPPGAKQPAPEADPTTMPRVTLDDEGNVVFSREVERKGFFMAMRKLILEEPLLCAQETGIEWLAWHDHKRPEKAVKLAELIDLYTSKPGMSTNEVSRSKLFWKEFTKAVGVDTAREITHEHVAAYEKAVVGKKYAPKSILHRCRKVRTVLAYAIKRGRGVEDCRRALDVTAMLDVKNLRRSTRSPSASRTSGPSTEPPSTPATRRSRR